MPRIAVYNQKQRENEYVDICRRCWPLSYTQLKSITSKDIHYIELVQAVEEMNQYDSTGIEHISYSEVDYCCQKCGKQLEEDDD